MSEPSRSPLSSLHLCNTTDRRGAELSTVDLVAALRARGLQSRAMALQPGSSDDPLPLGVLGRRGRTPLALARLRRASAGVDLLVAHGASSLLASYVATLGGSSPFIYRMIGDPSFWGQVRLHDVRVGRPLRAAARVVTLWQGAADAVHELHGVPEDRLAVIVNGRDPAGFRPPQPEERQAARAALGLPLDGPIIGYLGALRWEKDPLRAFEVAAAVPDAHLAVAGDGPLRAEVDAAASAAPPGTATVLGGVSDPQQFLWAIDVLLLTSKTEGLPGVVIEAGLCGIPAVAPDVGGTADLVSDRTGCLLARDAPTEDYAAAVVEVVSSAAARGSALRDRCLAGFTLDAAADRWVELLGAVMDEQA